MPVESAPFDSLHTMPSLKPIRNTVNSPPVNSSASQQSKRPCDLLDEPSRKLPRTDIAEKLSVSKSCVIEKKMDIIEGSIGDGEANAKVDWKLCPATGVHSKWWNHFMKFNPIHHKGYKDKAACILCFEEHAYTRGTVALKSGNTSGLKRHFQTHHRSEFDKTQDTNRKVGVTAQQSVAIGHFFPNKQQEHYLGIQDIKNQFKLAAASWMVQEAVPLSMIEAPTFRKLFEPFNRKSSDITRVGRGAIREQIMTMGRYAWAATQIEMKGREVSWTTDHWTGPNDETYSTVTAHFVTETWVLDSCCLDFKVFKGSTSGEAIYEDIQNVLSQFQDDATIVLDTIGITDTTGNMGKLGQFCRENGRRHGYCTDHNFHRNAIKAFNREYHLYVNYFSDFFVS